MIRLADEVRSRGGIPLSPWIYKQEFNSQLLTRIRVRLEHLKSYPGATDSYMIPGAKAMLGTLLNAGIQCHLASGTDESDVLLESHLLGIAKYFSTIQGARFDFEHSTKQQVIQTIIDGAEYGADEFMCFGDGYVEIRDTCRIGGMAIGVASNEDTK